MDKYLEVINTLNKKLNKAKLKKEKLREERHGLEIELGESAVSLEEKSAKKEELDYAEDVVINYRKYTKLAKKSMIGNCLAFIALGVGLFAILLPIPVAAIALSLTSCVMGPVASIPTYLGDTSKFRKIRKETILEEVRKEQRAIDIVMPVVRDKVNALKQELIKNGTEIEQIDKLIADLYLAINELLTERDLNLMMIESEMQEHSKTQVVPVADCEQIAARLDSFIYDPSKKEEIDKKYDELLAGSSRERTKPEGSK